MSAIDQVLAIAKAIEDEGKQPSLALIKAKLTQNLPMPELIKGLQVYKSLSDEQRSALSSAKLTSVATQKAEKTEQQRLAFLEQAVTQLREENLSLKLRLEKLEQRGTR